MNNIEKFYQDSLHNWEQQQIQKIINKFGEVIEIGSLITDYNEILHEQFCWKVIKIISKNTFYVFPMNFNSDLPDKIPVQPFALTIKEVKLIKNEDNNT